MEYETKISSQQGVTATNLAVHKNAKQKGELAELAFMYKAAGLGFGVAKPYGDSERFDFILSFGKQLWRVQVKSTYGACRAGYQVHASGTRLRSKYTPDEIDFLRMRRMKSCWRWMRPRSLVGSSCQRPAS